MRRDRLALPILLLLLTVLVPSVGVTWMMREAVRNERAATNQRLQEGAYLLQLKQTAEDVKDSWRRAYLKISARIDDKDPALSFAKIVSEEAVDSAVFCGPSGKVLYPEIAGSLEVTECEKDPRWQEANRMEFAEADFVGAGEIYDALITEYVLRPSQFSASLAPIVARARCFEKGGQKLKAIETLESAADFAAVGAGKSHQRASDLRLLEIADADGLVWKRAAARLRDQLLDYEESPMPSRERYFLTERYFELTGRSDEFPIYDAECLALQFVDQLNDANLKRLAGLRRAKISGVWQHCEKVGNVASLYRTETVRQNLLGHAKDFPVPEGVSVKVFAPDEVVDCLVEVSLGSEFSDWRLALVATGGDPFVESSNQRKAVYLWIAGVTVAATCVLGWLLLSMLRQRMKLAQLKNDLVATVSHELKTPLASIRLLVDTLLQNEDLSAGASDQNRTTEYLQLISVENARLTRLVDNFLTFSRMERGQQQFDFSNVGTDALIEKAVGVFLDHCPKAKECLTIDAQGDAEVSCDQDSMVTAIVNLLENAWKYGGQEKQITLTTNTSNGLAEIKVSDNGIGLSSGEIEKVFDRFYQVDQRVARTQGGCGLGLSIVRSIVEAHDGAVTATSKPNDGSTFVIQLPRAK